MSSRYKFACPRSAKVSIISVYKTVKSRLPERTVDRTGRAADMTHQTCAMWRWLMGGENRTAGAWGCAPPRVSTHTQHVDRLVGLGCGPGCLCLGDRLNLDAGLLEALTLLKFRTARPRFERGEKWERESAARGTSSS